PAAPPGQPAPHRPDHTLTFMPGQADADIPGDHRSIKHKPSPHTKRMPVKRQPLPQDAFTQIGAFISQGISVADFRLSPSGDWIVLGTGGHYAYSPTLDQPVIDSIADAVENRHLQPSKIVFS